jgi:hypothetical protein
MLRATLWKWPIQHINRPSPPFWVSIYHIIKYTVLFLKGYELPLVRDFCAEKPIERYGAEFTLIIQACARGGLLEITARAFHGCVLSIFWSFKQDFRCKPMHYLRHYHGGETRPWALHWTLYYSLVVL